MRRKNLVEFGDSEGLGTIRGCRVVLMSSSENNKCRCNERRKEKTGGRSTVTTSMGPEEQLDKKYFTIPASGVWESWYGGGTGKSGMSCKRPWVPGSRSMGPGRHQTATARSRGGQARARLVRRGTRNTPRAAVQRFSGHQEQRMGRHGGSATTGQPWDRQRPDQGHRW